MEAMGTYKLPYRTGDEILIFEALHSGAAIAFANEFDKRQGNIDTILWIRKDDGGWIVF